MILVGKQILSEQRGGNICIEPFSPAQINPNSYNYRLGRFLKVSQDDGERFWFTCVDLWEYPNGYTITPGHIYLGSTFESIGSKKYAMSLIGRSSIGRYGMFLQISANLGHTGSSHHWTLEIVPALPIKLYYRMIVGQVSFWVNDGPAFRTPHRYNQFDVPAESLPDGGGSAARRKTR